MDLFLIMLVCTLSAFQLSYAQEPVEEEMVVSRHFPPLGGWAQVNPQQTDVQAAAKKAVEKFNMKSKAKKYFKLVEITSAQIQITNVINYKINSIIGKTKCLKTEPADLESCALVRKRLTCDFEVKFDPRNDQYTAKTVSCRKLSHPWTHP